jgi:hypothetical protein
MQVGGGRVHAQLDTQGRAALQFLAQLAAFDQCHGAALDNRELLVNGHNHQGKNWLKTGK